MRISRYRLTALGKVGAALFILPTPIAAIYMTPPKVSEGQKAYNEALRSVGGKVEIFSPSPTILILLATAFLIGTVLLLIGRELVTTEE